MTITREIIVYFFIALIGYGVDVSVYLMLLKINLDEYSSYILALAVGLSFNVVLLRRFFKKGRFSLIKDIWLTFIANGAILLFGFGFYIGLLTFFEMGSLQSKLISNSITFILNFIIRKKKF